MTEAFICEYVRTPFGRYGGALSAVRADDLAAVAIRGVVARAAGLDPAAIDEVLFGCANQAGEDNRNVARMALLLAGLPESVPGATVNRLCGSGLDAVGSAARAIRLGEAAIAIAGGVENMSRAPFVMPKATAAFDRSNAVYDTTIGWRFVNPQMKAQFGAESMPETGENVAADFNVLREDQDRFALASQQKCKAAAEAGFFAGEITPVTIKGRKGDTVIDTDEHPRPETTLEGLAKLKTPFRDPGTVTAGNASGVNDGAAALILASEAAAKAHGLVPRGRVIGMATSGVPPRIMGMGPAPAVKKLLARTGVALEEIDVIELNEAFASQALAVTRDLGLAD
ncbi:MAG TPA: acetyl-CoA C-acyltransferase, partial [Acidiphilium sp.]|nr:acetyl-CoA C-acyltransferase [Acidiphilium sp.]